MRRSALLSAIPSMTCSNHSRYCDRKITLAVAGLVGPEERRRGHPMRVILSLVLVLLITVPASAAVASSQDPGLIMPGQRIGPAHLGMSRAAIDAVNRTCPCR